ncbi:hypothetical protein L7F22_067877 [Adiantum nelumboides]|nr:hypothetical protein [Adiantum nelumboides]
MGSPDKFGRQIDGLGGGTSTTSKLAIISKSKTPELAQIDYEFVQASTTLETLDFSGNCGNILSGVGPFAYEEGILSDLPMNGSISLNLRCLNNGQIFRSTFEVKNGFPVEFGSMTVDGVSAKGSPIKLDFLRPAGSMTGSLLPTGKPINHLPVYGFEHPIEVSCVDAANPFCFITLESLLLSNETKESMKEITDLSDRVERVRQAASLAMGITSSIESAGLKRGTPKICIVQKCNPNQQNGTISTQSWSMGTPHPALQLTGAACIVVAIHTPGTILNKLVCQSQIDGKVPFGPLRICHPAGAIEATADVVIESNGNIDVRSATLYRTARRLFKGDAYYVT